MGRVCHGPTAAIDEAVPEMSVKACCVIGAIP